jgi:hypothetical protein
MESFYQEMTSGDGKDLMWWLAKGRTGLADALEDAERKGLVQPINRSLRHPFARRFEVADQTSLEMDRAHTSGAVALGNADATDVAVAVIGAAAGMTRPPRKLPPSVLSAAGPLAWICAELAEGLVNMHARNVATTTSLTISVL